MLSATYLVKQGVVLKAISHISHVFIMQLNYLSGENLKTNPSSKFFDIPNYQ